MPRPPPSPTPKPNKQEQKSSAGKIATPSKATPAKSNKSRSGKPRHKGKGKANGSGATTTTTTTTISQMTSADTPHFFIDDGSGEATSEAGPSRRTSPGVSYTPTAFTPLPRSYLTGATLDLSPELSSRQLPSSTDQGVGDIVIDEIPLSSLPNDSATNQHFDPPGLFTTTMMPTLTRDGGDTVVELQKDARGDRSADEKQDGGLLLPSHILVDSVPTSSKGEADTEAGDIGHGYDDSMEGLHFVDDDISKGSKRYFDAETSAVNEVEPTFLATADQSKICQNCKRPGHKSKDCTHIICTTCGAEDSHERRDCPVALVCFGCGGRGHRKQDCPDIDSRMSRRTGCDRCGSRDHLENTCPTLWRVYSYRSREDREEVQKVKAGAEGWEKEAVGGAPSEEWCYNCAREGHFGDDCSQRRGSLAYLTVPSAFSYEMASRGPFASSSSSSSSSSRKRNLPAPTHARWTDEDDDARDRDLPFITGGYKSFGGANAGKKSREKARQRQYAKERERDSEEDDPSWFDTPSSSRGAGGGGGGGLNIRKRGGSRGGGGGIHTPAGQRGGAGRRPWDSEYREPPPKQSHGRSRDRDRERNRSRSPSPRRNGRREDGLPFSHGHLMTPGRGGPSAPSSAPAKVISFGKISAPGSSRGGVTDSPSIRRPGGVGSGSKALINRALGNASGGAGGNTPKSKPGGVRGGSDSPLSRTPEPTGDPGKRKRKRGGKEKEKEKDWEGEWRRGGNGGGNVASWGAEMDKESPQQGKGNGGFSIKGRSGQGQTQQSTPRSGGGGGRASGSGPTPGSQAKKGISGHGTPGQRYHGSYM
ncbi:hypothetical protein IAR55_001581 [Kwoniella newhampshirensis]|uniref:CCHC-type domain-containing protein n=1 Tax=Kwoniella newhampshirensis TaxID=1651941 RepID=A0AAW0Z2L9_9TREE